MIENESKLDKKDIKYLFNRKLYSRWFNIAFRILYFLTAIGFIVYGIYEINVSNEALVYNIFFILLGIIAFVSNLYLYNVYLVKKFEDIIKASVSKKYVIEKKYVKLNENIEGKIKNLQITFKEIYKAKIYKDRIYIYYIKDQELELFAIHDNGYIKGNKEDLIKLLNDKHIKIKNK